MTISEEIRAREFRLGDILSSGWHIFRSRFTTILAITLIIYIPINFILSLVPNDTLIDGQGFEGLPQYFQVVLLLENLFGVLATMAIAFIVEHSLAGEGIGYYQALNHSFSRWWSVIGTSILAGLILLGLTLLLIVPGIIWGVYYTFFLYVVALRGKGGKEALDYSKSLVKGHWGEVLGITLFFGILVFTAYWIVAIPFWFIPENIVTKVISDTLGDVVAAFFTVALVILFLNLDYLKNPQELPEPQFLKQGPISD